MDTYGQIARFYDWEHEHFQEDIPLYLNLVEDGPVLEIGVGTGRLMRPLLAAGFEVWGIDSSAAMLKIARLAVDSTPGAHLVHVSLLDFHDHARFRTALLPLNTLWHFRDIDEQVQALRRIHDLLLPGSLLICDCSNPLTIADRGATGEVRQRHSGPLADSHVTAQSATWDDVAAQELTVDVTYDEVSELGNVRRSRASLVLRYLYRFELEMLLRLTGFGVTDIYGSYDQEPYNASSPNLIALAISE